MSTLKKVFKSPLNQRIISFFHENPSTFDTPRGIAAWLNDDFEQIQKALDYLADHNVLVPHRTGSTRAYTYTQDRKILERLEEFLQK